MQQEPLLPLSKPSGSEQYLKAHPNGGEEFPEVLKGRRIVLATESYGPVNGVSRTTQSLVEYLRNNGVEVAVISPVTRSSISERAQATHRLDGYPLPYNPDLSVALPFRVDHLFQNNMDPDVVYLASPASVGFQFMLQLRLMRSAPATLCNFQTDLSAYAEILFPVGMNEFAVWLLKVVQGFLFSHSSVQTIFYPSKPIKQYLEHAGVSSSKLVHLGRGVDTELFHPRFRDNVYRAELAPNGEIILVTVCRLAPEKGFKFLADAVINLANEGYRFKLLIVGGNHNASVEEEVRKLFDPVKEKVIFTGFLTGEPLARAYASADLFLHCSVTETFGLVVLEAMASGLPVIARNQGGPSEIVRHEKTGYLVPPEDLEDFVQKIKVIAKSRTLRTTFVDAARQAAINTTWEKINRTVAWHIAVAYEKKEAVSAIAERWKSSGLRKQANSFVDGAFERVRLASAVCIVAFFWLIAVLPLMVHGNLVFKRKTESKKLTN